ncbi:hypothetical protein [Spiroplasma endosymbiont of Polydrusus pterygomalis]|uniref:hypothetical protein n=1 Tax=Spiroplasma endosymbiont of Polydrusus pterygomalis TaxID=3139327 RepID=UPI003CCADA7F
MTNISHSQGILFNNKLYFGSGDQNVYEYDPITKQQKIIQNLDKIRTSGLVLNNKIYFCSNNEGTIY